MVLAIMYLISWKKKNISVKMLVKAVIAQFLIAVILVKVPAGRYVVSKVSDAVTSVINCGQDGLSFVFGSLADSTAAAGSVFAIQVLGNIVFLSALVSFLYYIGILGFVVKWIGKAVGKLMGTSEVESFVAVANMFLGQTDSPMPVGSIMVAKMLLPQTEEVREALRWTIRGIIPTSLKQLQRGLSPACRWRCPSAHPRWPWWLWWQR